MNSVEDRDNEVPRSLQQLVRPHIDSFDHFLGEGLLSVVELLKPIEVSRTTSAREALQVLTVI